MTDQTTPPPDDPTLPDDAQDVEAAAHTPATDDAVPEAAVAEPVTGEPALPDESGADDETPDEIAAEADAADDSIEADADRVDDGDEYDDEDEYAEDDEDDYDPIHDPLTEEELEPEHDTTAPVDWAAMASSGAGSGTSDVPDLTFAGADAMDVDIDAALAAVDTLGAVVAAEQERKREEADRKDALRRADEEYRKWAESYVFRRPGMIRVQGGRVVTVLPAVALMAVGGVLTLATASGQPMSWTTLAAAASAGLSVSLLSYWLASGRWARGALFAGLLVAIGGGWVFAMSLPDVNLPWTLPFAATGAAFALTGLLGRPRTSSWILAGLGIVVGTLILPLLSQRFLVTAAPFVLIAAAVLALLPAVFRMRRA